MTFLRLLVITGIRVVVVVTHRVIQGTETIRHLCRSLTFPYITEFHGTHNYEYC